MALNTELFGGAIKVNLPQGFIDASLFRQVPDTQEVFVHQTVDDSMMFDLLERLDSPTDFHALKEHLDEISRINDTDPNSQLIQLYTETHPLRKKSISSKASPAYITVAIEPAKKWGRTTKLNNEPESANDNVLEEPILVLILVLIRIKDVETDFIVSYNTPITKISELKALQEIFDQNEDYSTSSLEKLPSRVQEGVKNIKEVLNSLEVEDWTLFA
ncbi:uncharacterized protein SAPINGB_P003837 [Magnusiomyces paraingens]|uniref:Ran guanine nucleotide release factor n=1 Tax=Magnusiomyces paraingens TaxID=2606893 RepID=A0A5E8BSF7_9ASCO|nr:uncharacterized protein SAPINGB_P003837 [Saprochaete ingens]VVT53961.1 unnamed protein product [Saprochaete ingens]